MSETASETPTPESPISAPTDDQVCALNPSLTPRTVYPMGWPAEVLEALDPALVHALEACIADVESAWYRLRPAAAQSTNVSEVQCFLLAASGEPVASAMAVELVAPHAQVRGLDVLASGECAITLREQTVDLFVELVPDVEPTAPRRRRSE